MDSPTTRLAVQSFCGVAALCVAGLVLLSAMGKEVPPTLATLAAACLGAVSGILAARVPTQPPRP